MSPTPNYGTNIVFIEELYEKYRIDPASVSESWREFFADYAPADEAPASAPAAPSAAVPPPQPAAPVASTMTAAAPKSPTAPAPGVAPEQIVPLRGAASKIVSNMEASLEMPTATTLRVIPVKALEENRRIINNHLTLIGQNKASYTHVIAWALIRALKEMPRMNACYAEIDGQPARIDQPDINFGLAIDLEKKDGSRSLLVPNIKKANTLDFSQFLKAYNDLIKRARGGQLGVPDFEGTTVSLTNPGTLGTISSIPRLMRTQGCIIATGQIDVPAEYSATDPQVLAELGVSKVMTITSTYDHRIIQGAESGAFLARVHNLLLGADNFYDELFRDLRIPYEPMRWSRDRKRSLEGGRRSDEDMSREAGVLSMINAYRVRGHLLADLDPLEYKVGQHAELNPAYYGLTLWDLDRDFVAGGLCGRMSASLREILDTLRETYCGKLAPEYMFIQDPVQKRWLQDRMEPLRNSAPLEAPVKRRILKKLNDSEVFEKFLHTKYVGHKRFSLEGAETLVPMLDHGLTLAALDGVEEVVIGMAHRGRLNVLATIMGKEYEKIFSEFEGDIDENTAQGSGDVKYHLGATGTHVAPDGRTVILTLASNPSHLEAVDPVVEGMARAKQKLLRDTQQKRVVPILLHGDAAFAGQGVVAETLSMSQLKGYTSGGTIHLVINNQIGFTTGPESARSSVYSTEIAKMIMAPIFHVNGDDPEACVRAMSLAFAFRQRFQKDVVIDMVCYRRHGHNEGDDPSLTQPKMYKLIKEHRSVRKLYTEALLRKGDLQPDEAEQWLDAFRNQLQEAFDHMQQTSDATPPAPAKHDALWTDEEVTGNQDVLSADTGITPGTIAAVGRAISTPKEGFHVHPKVKGILEKRGRMAEGTEKIDWAFAETMAFGSILHDGHCVRLSGQDVGRGTFSHRHAVLHDYTTGEPYIPLNALAKNFPIVEPERGPDGKRVLDPATTPVYFSVYDSLLSEYGVLGFEYGYSVADPSTLVVWEAQFGDFMNGAQIIIDQFLSSAEEKWSQHSGLVMLLPHGFEGQGPEHSSARLERFLTLCAEGNMQVMNLTTPAQYFHALRRQMVNDPRKPLVIMTPKSLLRHPAAVSSVEELSRGRLEPVLDDPYFAEASKRNAVERIVLVSGKLYYDLKSARDAKNDDRIAIVRLEQFYPFPRRALQNIFGSYPNAQEIFWVQEEPRNMGGWNFIHHRIEAVLGGRKITYYGRPIAASPATGHHARHEQQHEALIEHALGLKG
ncbi:MAG: multifunctional oxoglutarate decarboxylase/oxoglutarate dehydrogenase thiamine pyrophosphate-binding subunit/dihydrolipoyllysine-residue succinyltransferase subunit [Thermoanaerobaculia bacterium]|nr:multifunctional oxoglutarate decarboxylase/oxoglutarate dehydrogenase thiamine pyrophosphate-binding subunit/dihydrolipoyllysine-residue succinyltransferase subunit [Thermoanaerobaculia bacterium]